LIDDMLATYEFLAHKRETEIRVILSGKATSYFVTDQEQFVDICKKWDGQAHVYVGINERKGHGTKDSDVIAVKTIVLDVDPERIPGTSATEKQVGLARKQAEEIAHWCEQRGWKRPSLVMSGNGYHLWFAIPEINITDQNCNEIEAKLKIFEDEVRRNFKNSEIKVDHIQNLSRLIRVPGTVNLKGEIHRRTFTDAMVRREDVMLRDYVLGLKPPVTRISYEGSRPLQVELGPIQGLCDGLNNQLANGSRVQDWSQCLYLLAAELLALDYNKQDIVELLLKVDKSNVQKFCNRRDPGRQIESLVVDAALRDYGKNAVSCVALQKAFGLLSCQECNQEKRLPLSKRKYWRIADRPVPDEVQKTVEEARSDIESLIRAHNEGTLAIGSAPGVGKSTIVCKVLREKELRTLYLVPNHKLDHEIIKNLGAIPIHGRNRQNCYRFDEAHAAGSKGWSVHGAVCKKCDRRSSCSYLAQFDRSKSWVAPHQYLTSSYLRDGIFDILVVDEFLIQSFIAAQEVSTSDLDYTKRLFGHISSMKPITEVIDVLLDIVSHHKAANKPDPIYGRDLIMEIKASIDLDAALEELRNAEWVMDMESNIKGMDAVSLPLNYLEDLVDILEYENSLARLDGFFNSRLNLGHDGLVVYSINYQAGLSIPVIILDGTMNEDLVRSVFGHDTRIYNSNIKCDAEIVQIVDGFYGKNTLLGPNERPKERLLNVAKILATEKTVMCSRMDLESQLPATDTFHYWAERGTNTYRDFEQIVLFGGACPNPRTIIPQIRALHYAEEFVSDKGDYEWVPYCSASEAYKIKQFTYEDARVQGWIDCLGAGEMVQSLHRIRPLLDPNKKIYVLSNKPLKSLNPTRLVELRRLEDELGIKEDPETRIRDWIEESLHSRGEVSREDVFKHFGTTYSKNTVDKYLGNTAMELGLKKVKRGRSVSYVNQG
jgi:hypothetical protein